MRKGLVIRGEIGRIIVREKFGAAIELGELLIIDTDNRKMLMQAYDLLYASQLSEQNIELISGLQLEETFDNTETIIMEPTLRNYKLALLKGLVTIEKDAVRSCKDLPAFLSPVRDVTRDDLAFITKPKYPMYLGKLRSGSKVLDVPIYLQGKQVFAHHILIAATTGKGKSNLTATMLWDVSTQDYCGVLVLDPHDEYYGRNPNKKSLKDHPQKERISYWTSKNPPTGAKTMKIHLSLLRPQHFAGVVQWSDAQYQALYAYYKIFGKDWVHHIIAGTPNQTIEDMKFNEGTVAVIRRRFMSLLDLDWNTVNIVSRGIFDTNAGITTIKDIATELEQAKTVIVDTSNFKGATELLIGSLISTEILHRYQEYKRQNILHKKPVISIVIEEAPRVIGKEVLEKGQNIFGTIAREGRKFQIGLIAITQLPSLIPREILANMNTKIIMGIEMAAERQAVIESAAQDLSQDNRNIASLDKGEALITSNFSRFATPIKAEYFQDYAEEDIARYKREGTQLAFGGIQW